MHPQQIGQSSIHCYRSPLGHDKPAWAAHLFRGYGVSDVTGDNHHLGRRAVRLDLLLQTEDLLLGLRVPEVMKHESYCAVLRTFDRTCSADTSRGPCDTHDLTLEETHLLAWA